jgi:polyferredoxin
MTRISKQSKRQKRRSALLLITFLLFPVVMNFLSPYVIIDAAFKGIVNGSFILFGVLLISSFLVGRAWCGWVCPAAGLQEAACKVNERHVRKIDWLKWVIWILWLGVIILGVITSGGYSQFDPLYLTESGISVDAPEKYIIYYIVVGLVFTLSVVVGRRAFCHSTCWMAPVMIIGRKARNMLNTPALRLTAESEKCIDCDKCTKTCSMSLNVNQMVRNGSMENAECILCGQCIDICPKNVIHYAFKPGKS